MRKLHVYIMSPSQIFLSFLIDYSVYLNLSKVLYYLSISQKYNTESRGEYSQTRRPRTASAVYRAGSMEILRSLADTAEHKNGVHFVRCMRAALSDQPLAFQPDVVRQQLKALAVVETVLARQNGYSCRISFHEFIRRCVPPQPKNYIINILLNIIYNNN